MSIVLEDFTSEPDVTGRVSAQERELIRGYVSKYLQVLGAASVPKVSVHNNLGSPWLGRTAWRSSHPKNTNVQLQKSILHDPRTLERVIAHEIAHHVQFTTMPQSLVDCFQRRRCRLPPGHGERFIELAKVINDHVGDAEFVTEKSDESYAVAETKTYMLLIAWLQEPYARFAYAWAAAPPRSPRTIRWLRQLLAQGARLAGTRDLRFAAKGVRFGGGMSVPQTEEEQEILKSLYLSGQQVDVETKTPPG